MSPHAALRKDDGQSMATGAALVSKALKQVVHPVLRNAGFTAFAGRNAWRYSANRIEVVNFRSLSTKQMGLTGCTTGSFMTLLGSMVPEREYTEAFPRIQTMPRPDEVNCQFRRTLTKSVLQPECEDREIWYVDPACAELPQVMGDVCQSLIKDAWNWFDKYADNERVVRVLQTGEDLRDGTDGMGACPSPIRGVWIGTLQARIEWASSRK